MEKRKNKTRTFVIDLKKYRLLKSAIHTELKQIRGRQAGRKGFEKVWYPNVLEQRRKDLIKLLHEIPNMEAIING